MTRDEVLAMAAGPELDDALAPLLGYEVERFDSGPAWWVKDEVLYEPQKLSSTWEGMRLLIEALKTMGQVVFIKVDGIGIRDGKLYSDALPPYVVHIGEGEVVRRDTAPHAVALAALLAKEGGDAR